MMGKSKTKETFMADLPLHLTTDDQQLTELVQQLNCCQPIDEQQQIIRKVAKNLSDDITKECAAKVLSYIFLTAPSNSSIRKTVSRILINSNAELIQKGIVHCIKCIVESTLLEPDPTKLYLKKAHILSNFMCCFENMPIAVKALSDASDIMLPFAVDQYVQLAIISCKRDPNNLNPNVNNYLITSSKFLQCLIQQCKLGGKLKKLSANLLKHCQDVIVNDELPLELRANCAHIMTSAIDYLPKQEKTNFSFKVYPCLELMKKEDVCQFDISTNLTSLMCIYSAIISNVPEEVLCEMVYKSKPVILYIFGELIDLTALFSDSPSHMINIGRTLMCLTRMLNGIALDIVEPMFSKGLEYISVYLDHFVENVRQSIKIVFQNFTKLAIKHFRNGNPLLFKMIQLSIWDLLLNQHAHYTYLTILSSEISTECLLETFENLPYLLLTHLDNDDSVAAEVCTTYEQLMSHHVKNKTDIAEEFSNTWLDPIIKMLESVDDTNVMYYRRIIKTAFLLQPNCIERFTHFQYSPKASELCMLLECLRVARKNDITIHYKETHTNSWRNYMEHKTMQEFMCHTSDDVRVSLLGLIVESHKSTEIFTLYELKFLKDYFKYNASVQEPSVRQEISCLYKKALMRMKSGYMLLKRNADPQIKEYDSFYEDFIKSYLKKGICTSDCNIYRRSMCLDIIVIMSEIVPHNIWNDCWNEKDLRYLYNLFDDPYESTLVLALKLINKLISDGHHHKFGTNVESTLIDCLNAACSIQPSETTKYAYHMLICLQHPKAMQTLLRHTGNDVKYKSVYELAIFFLLKHLDKKLKNAETNLKKGLAVDPFYGLILNIRYIINYIDNSEFKEWTLIIDTVFSLCQRMSDIVGPIISNSSPEGFVPNEFQNTEQPLAQKVLLFGWRSTKEMSLLLGELMDKLPTSDPNHNDFLFSSGIINKAEDYFLKLFFETKHRGAFEQAYVGFCQLCKKLWEISQNGHKCYPEYWLKNVLIMLDGNLEEEIVNSKLCATRRSAGLPFMIQAILVSQPKNNHLKIFSNCMEKLLHIAESNDNESSVHALNILRALYRHNQLNEKVIPYVPRGFIVSINGCGNASWAIRNSSTLLFSALMTRTFGVQRIRDVEDVSIKNKLSSRVFFTRYTGLYNFLLNKVKEFQVNTDDNNFSVYPVLLILCRLYSSNVEEEKYLLAFLPYISRFLRLPSYGIRQLAAKASVCLIPTNYVVPYMMMLLRKLSNNDIDNNYCHSILLQLKFMLNTNVPEIKQNFLPKALEKTFWIFMCAGNFTSRFTASLYFDVIADFVTKYNASCYGSDVFTNLSRLLLVQTVRDKEKSSKLVEPNGRYNRNRFFLHVYLVTTVYDCSDLLTKANYIKQFLMHGLSNSCMEVVEFVVDYLIYVGFHSPVHKLHALYLLEELEICDYAKRAVDSLSDALKDELLNVLNVVSLNFLDSINNLKRTMPLITQKLFLLVYEYPSLLFKLHHNYVCLIDHLLSYMFRGNDILHCAVLGCISRVLESVADLNGGRPFDFALLVKVLKECASGSASVAKKLTLAQLLVANRKLLLYNSTVLSDAEKIQLWNAAIILLNDYDPQVRDTISKVVVIGPMLKNKHKVELYVLPEGAKELLVHMVPRVLHSSSTIRLLISWCLNGREKSVCTTAYDSSAVFRAVEDNPYAEDEPLIQYSLEALRKHLWVLDNGLSYEDYSIFLEEHLLLIATKVQNAIDCNDFLTFVEPQLRTTLIEMMKRIIEFLESTDIGKPNFKKELNTKVINEFQRNLNFDENVCDRLKRLTDVIFGLT